MRKHALAGRNTQHLVTFFRKILTLERRLELSESSREISRERFLEEVRGVVSDSELSEKISQIEIKKSLNRCLNGSNDETVFTQEDRGDVIFRNCPDLFSQKNKDN